MSFMLPIEMADPEVRPGIERAAAGARANGTPFISFFTPTEMLTLARDAGFREVQHVSAATLAQRYFAGRTDGLRPPNNSEELVVATVCGFMSLGMNSTIGGRFAGCGDMQRRGREHIAAEQRHAPDAHPAYLLSSTSPARGDAGLGVNDRGFT